MTKPAVQERASGPTIASATASFKGALRLVDVDKRLLRRALDNGDLPSTREAAAVEHGEPSFVIGVDDLLAWYARLPTCRVPGCDGKARTLSGACSRTHSLRGHEVSADVREKIAASKRGKLRPAHVGQAVASANRRRPAKPRAGEERWCEWCGESLGIVRPSLVLRGASRFCNPSHARRWQIKHEPHRYLQFTLRGRERYAKRIRRYMREGRLFKARDLRDPEKVKRWEKEQGLFDVRQAKGFESARRPNLITGRTGRPSLVDREDFAEKTALIRKRYAEITARGPKKASERQLARMTGVTEYFVQVALGRKPLPRSAHR